MPEPPPLVETLADADGVTEGRWLGGVLTLLQPRRGHRVGTDAALLVAAAGEAGRGRIVDVGAGVGAVGLALAKRSAPLSADLVEIDPGLAELAASNAARNGLEPQARILRIDALDPGARRKAGLSECADYVVTNPPFFEAGTVRVSPDESKARAHVMPADAGATLADWISASLAMLRPGGRFVMIHRPEALGAILAGIGSRLGGIALLPVHPAVGASAIRVLVSGVKGSKAPLRLAPGLILHEADGRLTAEADAIHRGQRLVAWGD
ncbi:MAG TPA: methyltransferase [Roseiarcus sp.]|jgi:tRNA1(Val) A37 N6-methylase TrmN6